MWMTITAIKTTLSFVRKSKICECRKINLRSSNYVLFNPSEGSRYRKEQEIRILHRYKRKAVHHNFN
jgi:hypothetical protein